MRHEGKDHGFKTVYFYRLFVPLIISILILFAIVAVITTPPGKQLEWATYNSPYKQLGRRG